MIVERELKDVRLVKDVVVPTVVTDGAGVRLKRSIATPLLDHLDPFFLFDNFGSENPDDYIAGFPMHPHRGIETVTYMLDGSVTHRDSLGNQGTVHSGDVQWMTAGSGIMHEEMPHAGPRRLDGFQVWVNLPRKLKMTTPRYQDVPSGRIPEVTVPGGARVRVVAGNVDGVEGAVREIFAGPSYLDVALPAGATFEHPTARGHTALLYVFQGKVEVAGKPVPSPRLAVLGDGDVVRVRAPSGDARFLVLSAQPLEEPAVRHGPFVMNTEDEIREALLDLRKGTFVRTMPAGAAGPADSGRRTPGPDRGPAVT
jgi:redox-sensitive bicupin YhaK (pirin superfamily)